VINIDGEAIAAAGVSPLWRRGFIIVDKDFSFFYHL
jgi:hypothetical protein